MLSFHFLDEIFRACRSRWGEDKNYHFQGDATVTVNVHMPNLGE